MDGFTVRATPEAFLSAAKEVQIDTSKIKSAFVELQGKIRGTSAIWTGEAAELYRSLFEEQVPEMEAVICSMADQSSKLNQIAVNYAGVQKESMHIAENLPSDVIL